MSVVDRSADRPLGPAERGFPAAFARGWYQIGWSGQLASGDVRPLRHFASDLVTFRDELGRVRVMDAFCQHYGAHLGFGGAVEGDSIRCPYHGWVWDAEGRNSEVPYGDGRCSKRTIRVWPVREESGVIYLWYAPDRREPEWDPPILPAEDEPGYYAMYPGAIHEEVVSFPSQCVVENMGDLSHLKFVHRFAEIPTAVECAPNGHVFRTTFEGMLPGANGHVPMRLTQEAYGIGMIRTQHAGAGSLKSIGLTAMTPIDANRMVMRFSYWISAPDDAAESDGPSGVAARYIKNNLAEALGPNSDRPIWENMTYLSNPAFTREEVATVRVIRQWIRQFFTPGSENTLLDITAMSADPDGNHDGGEPLEPAEATHPSGD